MRQWSLARLFPLIFAVVVGVGPATAWAAEAKKIEIVSLESSLGPLEQYFNANKNRARVLVLLSPT
ncbi:MAG TPA: hypothetical protein VGM86_20330 [Thermoanaerobaculia bacterium]|jgi:hypothetical protein